MAQKFYANPQTRTVDPNGAIRFAPGGMMDCLGHYAKVQNCPIAGTQLRLTCYATGYADTWFSVPACTRYRGRYITGYFTSTIDGVEFRPHTRHHEFLGVQE